MDANRFLDDVIRDVSELPDRTSPARRPDLMVVTADELRAILIARFEQLGLELILEDIIAEEKPAGHA